MRMVSGAGRRTQRGASFAQWLVGVGVVALVAALAAGGCALSRMGALDQTCTADSECDDGNPCTEGSCSADGFCSYVALPDGEQAQQTPHDCRTELCEGGQPVTAFVASDRPINEPCLTYGCDEDTLALTEEATLAGDPCELNGVPGTCSDEGNCNIGCVIADECDDQNACTVDDCNVGTGECVYEPLNNVKAPGSQQINGDCQQIMCQDGNASQVIDDTDLPLDANDCTEDLCNEGVPTNPPRPINFGCSVPNGQYEKVCDGQGSCVECNGTSQCDHLPADTFCGIRTCTAGVCGQDCTTLNTPTPAQQPNDCKTEVCDGACSTTQIADPADLPEDNNDCTQDLCTGMTPSNPPEPLNTACGSQGTLYCNGSGSCVGCTHSDQCPSDVFCRDHYCNNQTEQCDWTDTANNTPLPTQDQTDGDCQQLQCNGSGGVKSVSFWDPFVDGNECTADQCSGGNPVNPNRPLNYGCNQNGGSYCDGSGVCVECNAANQCPAAPDCQVETCVANSCVNAFEPNTTPAPPSYQTPGDCNTVMCNGSGGVNGNVPANDPFDDGNECTSDLCSGGVPSNPPVSNGIPCTSNGLYCDGAEECQSGVCTSPGDPCGPVGDDNCQACNEGADDCSANEPGGSPCDDNLHCNGTDTCNGSGSCSVHSGDPCAPYADGDCAGGCDETADDCGGNEPGGSACDDGQFCNGADTCDGGGNCSSHAGDPCLPYADADCAGGCDEGVDSCSAPEPGGSACDDGVFCNGADTCDGSGNCATHAGNPCLPYTDADCAGGCNEGVDDCSANEPGGSPCDDALYCNGIDTCDGSGNCGVHTGDPCLPYTDADCGGGCDEGGDSCNGNEPGGSVCDDGLFCNGTDTCDGSGNCGVHSGDPCGPYNDADCAGGCDDGTDTCTGPEPGGSLCDDGLFCNGPDSCDGSGNCSTHGGDPCAPYTDADCAGGCDDGTDTCTGPEPGGSVCDDTLYCNGTDTCDGGGLCANHSGDPCAAFVGDCDDDCMEACEESSDTCSAAEDATACAFDNITCDDVCSTGTCTGS